MSPDYTWNSTSWATCFSANFSTHTTQGWLGEALFKSHPLLFQTDSTLPIFLQATFCATQALSTGAEATCLLISQDIFTVCNSIMFLTWDISSNENSFLDVYFFSLVTVIHNLHHKSHLLSSFLRLYSSVYFLMSFLISILHNILPEEVTVLHHFGPSYYLVRN